MPALQQAADSAVLDEITRHRVGKLSADKGDAGKALFKKLWRSGSRFHPLRGRNLRLLRP